MIKNKNKYKTGIANDIENVLKHSSKPVQWEFLYKYCQKKLNKNIKILDIGCGTGNKMLYLYNHGYKNIIGIEYNPNAYKKMLIKYPVLKIKRMNAEKLSGLKNKQFDLAYCDQVLEHLPQPELAIKEAWRVLKKNGIYIIGIPNGKHLNDKIIRIIQKIVYKNYDHLQKFSLKSIKNLLTKNGFYILEIKKINGSLDFMLDDRIKNKLIKSIIKIIYPIIKKVYYKTTSYEILAIKKII